MFFRRKIGLNLLLIFIGLLWFGAVSLRALDRYVVEPGTIPDGNGGIYTGWDIAATQIQWAVNASTNAGDTVWVSNGTYVLTNQINVTSNIVLRSTNGPDVTIVNGGFVAGLTGATTNNRCLYMSNSSAFVSGFTFSNGAYVNPGGGGVWLARGVLSNCTVCNNTFFPSSGSAEDGGGGILMTHSSTIITACRITGNMVTNPGTTLYGYGGGIYNKNGGTIVNCLISNNVIRGGNTSRSLGGGFFGAGTVQSCLICNNSNQFGCGGGSWSDNCQNYIGNTVSVNYAVIASGLYMQRSTLTNCVVSSNNGDGISMDANTVSAVQNVLNTTVIGNTGIGIVMDNSQGTSKVSDCVIVDNISKGITMLNPGSKSLLNGTVRNNKAGGIDCRDGAIRNCLIAGNTNSGTWGGVLIEANAGTALVSCCTVVSNQSAGAGSGLRIEATRVNLLISFCVIYSNGVAGTNDVYDLWAPTNYNNIQYSCLGTNPGFTGAVVIVTDPKFKDFTRGNFRLAGNSPCVNRGSNETWMTNACDLDKNQRIRYGVVDMGAYERINEGTIYKVH